MYVFGSGGVGGEGGDWMRELIKMIYTRLSNRYYPVAMMDWGYVNARLLG